jgi:inosine-uridine nucleoside N-ribohydrolase
MLAGSTERADAARGRITVPAQAPRLPVIIDTEIGGEPDDAIALAVAARELPELALVVTSDEISGQRARFTRFLLDSLHRPDVDVVAGGQLSAKPCYFADGLTPAEVAGQPGDLALAVAEVCARGDGRARWIGLGPLTNLAAVLTADPGLAGRLSVTQLGGSVREGRPSVPQRNFRLDPASARIVLAAARDLRVVNVDAAFGRDAPVTAASPLYRELADASAPGWARLLAAHCAQFFARYHPAVIPASPLTLSAALHLPFAQFRQARVSVDRAGRMREDHQGASALISGRADAPALGEWLHAKLRPVAWPGRPVSSSIRRRSPASVT